MTFLIGRHILLRPLENQDLETLYKFRNSLSFINLCSVRRNTISIEEFKKELEKDFERDRHIQFLIEHKKNNQVVGTIYSYNFNKADGHAFITTYIDDQFQNKGYGAEAFILFLSYLFKTYSLYKVYTEVYEYNFPSLSALQNTDFSEEGRFKKHKLFDGKRYDLIRFAIYRSSLDKIDGFLSRLNPKKKEGE